MNYLTWIDEQITKYQTEIARLTIARAVIEEAGDIVRHRDKPKLLTKPKAKPNTRDAITAAMTSIGKPAESKIITAEVLAAHPELTQKSVWNALYNMRISGYVTRDDEGRYMLAVTPKPTKNEETA